MIDDIVNHYNIDDTELVHMVRRQPVVGVLLFSNELVNYTHVSELKIFNS